MRLCLLLLAFLASPVVACDYITVFVRSYHFQRNHNFNEANYGLGCERVLSDSWRASGGFYRNSIRKDSVYLGASYAPLTYGNWRLGTFAGFVTGYKKSVVPAVFPTLSYERDRWGFNLIIVPPFKEDPGVIGLQLKWLLGS